MFLLWTILILKSAGFNLLTSLSEAPTELIKVLILEETVPFVPREKHYRKTTAISNWWLFWSLLLLMLVYTIVNPYQRGSSKGIHVNYLPFFPSDLNR